MLEKEKLNIVDEDLIISIYKAIEIFDVMKNTKIRINNELINNVDKKYLSLLLGVYFNKNNVSKMLKLLRYNYDIEVYTFTKKEEEYERLYNQHFEEIMNDLITDEDISIESFMLKLIDVDFIKDIHNRKGMSLIPLRLLLNESLKNKQDSKTLQKK